MPAQEVKDGKYLEQSLRLGKLSSTHCYSFNVPTIKKWVRTGVPFSKMRLSLQQNPSLLYT